MWWFIAAIFIFAVSLIPGAAAKFESTVEGISGALTKGPTKTVVNAWIEVAAIGAALGVGVWFVETRLAKHEGVAGPQILAAGATVAPPPSFGSSSGFGVSPAGPVYTQAVTAGSGGSSAGPSTDHLVASGGGDRQPRRARRQEAKVAAAQRKAEIARANVAVVRARADEAHERQRLSGFEKKAA